MERFNHLMNKEQPELPLILEAILLACDRPLSLDQLAALFPEEERPEASALHEALTELARACECRGIELKQVASGFRFQVKQALAPWVSRLWEEKPQRYTRALLETLALIAYRQPITRGEIEDVRGVSVSSNIIRTLQEREWIRVVGHRDVPGRPAMFATTRQFLDYFNLANLNELPSLSEIRDLDEAARALENQQTDMLAALSADTDEPEAGEDEVLRDDSLAANALFAELDELEADLPDNFDDLITRKKVNRLSLDHPINGEAAPQLPATDTNDTRQQPDPPELKQQN